MRFLTLIFILLHFFYLFNSRQLYYLLQKYTTLLSERENDSSAPNIIFVGKSSLIFFVYMIFDFIYLLFCLWLLFTDNLWQIGGMLFIISALETYAFHAKVSFTYIEDVEGFIYPRSWCRCLFTGLTLFILTRLYLAL